jgi:hypothetical protein
LHLDKIIIIIIIIISGSSSSRLHKMFSILF